MSWLVMVLLVIPLAGVIKEHASVQLDHPTT